MACESRRSAWEKLACENSFWALLLSAKASRLSLATDESSSPPHNNNWTMMWAARAGVPQCPTITGLGRATRLGPEPQRPKQPQDLTVRFGGARAKSVSKVSREPCLRHVRFVQTLISKISLSLSFLSALIILLIPLFFDTPFPFALPFLIHHLRDHNNDDDDDSLIISNGLRLPASQILQINLTLTLPSIIFAVSFPPSTLICLAFWYHSQFFIFYIHISYYI